VNRPAGPDQIDLTASAVTNALDLVTDELYRAIGKFDPFASAHEGYAVILEELDEMWHEVKHGTRELARAEAVQVAAMALRFLIDIPVEEARRP
jgi:hypothetical protein